VNELQLQFEKLSNQARFVKLIVNKELVVSNRKKADIVEELRQKKFRPFSKVAKAKAAGETENVEADEEAEEAATGTSTDYDYLLGMAIWSLTKEKVRMGPYLASGPSSTHATSTPRSRSSFSKRLTRRRAC
jgi:DNA topoisomerase II